MSSMRSAAALAVLTLSQLAAAGAALSGWLRWSGTVPVDYAGPRESLSVGERVDVVTGLGTMLPMFDYSATGSFELARPGDARTAWLVGYGARVMIAAIVVANLYAVFATRRRGRPLGSRQMSLRLARVGLGLVTVVFAGVVAPLGLMFASIDNDFRRIDDDAPAQIVGVALAGPAFLLVAVGLQVLAWWWLVRGPAGSTPPKRGPAFTWGRG
jgi:hypothetical protein